MTHYAIGIDLGGTSIKGMVLGDNGYRSNILRVPSGASSGGAKVLDNIIRVIDQLIGDFKGDAAIGGVGLGSPGFIDADGTVLGGAENLPGWEGMQIVEPIEQKFGLKVKAANDVTVMAYAEYRFGAARGVKNCVCYALGTGVGGGLIINGQLYDGSHGMAGELGHVVVDTNGVACNCSQRGCLEQYAAAPAIVRIAHEECVKAKNTTDSEFVNIVLDTLETVTSKLVYDYVNCGDPVALKINEIVCEKLAGGIGIAANIIAPDRVVLGGGVMMAGQVIVDTVNKYVSRYCWKSIRDRFDIRIAELGEDAGVLGAAALGMRDSV